MRNKRTVTRPASGTLVRGGRATRWREHPLVHTWVLYRLLDRRIPAAYRSWALGDIDGFRYPMRRFLGNAWPVFAIGLSTSSSRGFGEIPVWSFVMVALMVISSKFITPEWHRSQARLKHGDGARVLVGIASSPLMGGHRVVSVAILLVALGVGVLGAVALLLLPGALVTLLVTRHARRRRAC